MWRRVAIPYPEEQPDSEAFVAGNWRGSYRSPEAWRVCDSGAMIACVRSSIACREIVTG